MDHLAARAGYERRGQKKPVDLRGVLDDPVEAFERANNRPVLLNIPGEECRGRVTLAFPLTKNSPHPFILTAISYIAGRCTNYNDSPLYEYFQKFQPDSCGEFLGLPEDEICGIFANSPLCSVLPWLGVPREKNIKVRSLGQKAEAYEHGFHLDGADGSSGFGPVSNGKGDLEFYRVRSLVDSIRKYGYSPAKFNANPIGGYVLIKKKKARVAICGAQHRAAVLVALGWHNIPVLLRPGRYVPGGVVFRESVSEWPGVRAGVFSEEQALNIFDRVFEGRQPPSLERVWPPEHFKSNGPA